MRIQVKRPPFTMKSCLLASVFLCMLVFASFTKEDIQKVRDLKKKLILRINPKIKKNVTDNVALDT